MSDYDNLRKQAEQLFGRDAVDRIEQKLKGSSEDKVRKLIDIDGADMRPTAPRGNFQEHTRRENELDEAKASEEKARQVEHQKEVLQAAVQQSATERLLAQAIKGEYQYAMLGLVLGLATILGGVILGLHGVVGSTSWTAKLLGFESHLNDAAPGVVLFVVGIFFVRSTRPKIKMRDLKG